METKINLTCHNREVFSGKNIFSEFSWSQKWNQVSVDDARYEGLVADKFPEGVLIRRKRKRMHVIDNYIEYPGGELACNVDIRLSSGDIDNLLKDKTWDVIDLRHLDRRSSILDMFCESAGKKNFLFRVIDDDSVWTIDLPDTFEKYLRKLPVAKKKKFSYYLRRIEKMNEFEFSFLDKDFEAGWNDFLNLHNARIARKGDKTLFSDRMYRSFYKEIYDLYAVKGMLKIAMLKYGGKICGSLFGINKDGVFYYINSGFLGEVAKYSPGVVMPLFCIKDSIKSGVKQFNLLMGNEQYKSQLLARGQKTKRILIFRNHFGMIFEKTVRMIKHRD